MGQATGLTTHAGAMRTLAERWLRVRGDGEQRAVDGDFVCSPAGLWLALGAVTAGARGRPPVSWRRCLGSAVRAVRASVVAVAVAVVMSPGL